MSEKERKRFVARVKKAQRKAIDEHPDVPLIEATFEIPGDDKPHGIRKGLAALRTKE